MIRIKPCKYLCGCGAVGPDACDFYASTTEEISNNLDSQYEGLLTEPVPVVSTSSYGIVDCNVLKTAVLVSLYEPIQIFFYPRAGPSQSNSWGWLDNLRDVGDYDRSVFLLWQFVGGGDRCSL
ncbi:hypothetical protein IW261DRAFT_6670 [Armillaria novae-zelandiae]|uniref:Uncharacterized protein n=1 Tax=Armillaria novae-zelandiae TaxID=153914 RepID=A0AA39TID2_9AGAR|nr:hypothetical protein IW261DRAFT_6670 [Armillaria novae-zelandiae]